MTETTSGFFELGDGRLYYQTAGTGDPLVLVHAGFLDNRMFDGQWDALAGSFRVIRFDMQGYGQSSPVKAPVCRRDDLHRLLEHLQVEQAHFVGCSLGGEIVLDLALEHPGIALSLTMVNAAPGGFEMQGEPPPHFGEMFAAAASGDLDRVSELQIQLWIDGMKRGPDEVDPVLRAQASEMNRIAVENRTFFLADMQPACPLDPPAMQRLGEVQCPVLLVVGALDHPEVLRAAEAMAVQVPKARRIVIDGAAHVPSFEQPQVFNTILLEFLGDAQRSAAS